MGTRSFRKSLAVTTLVRADQDAAFKKCCLRSGRYDGANRNHFFPRGSCIVRLAQPLVQYGCESDTRLFLHPLFGRGGKQRSHIRNRAHFWAFHDRTLKLLWRTIGMCIYVMGNTRRRNIDLWAGWNEQYPAAAGINSKLFKLGSSAASEMAETTRMSAG
jgi:hypothetical protein